MALTPINASVKPSAALWTDVYTATESSAVRVLLVNIGGADVTFRITHAPSGAVLNDTQYRLYDDVLVASEPGKIVPIAMNEGDVIRVYTDLATLIATVNGWGIS